MSRYYTGRNLLRLMAILMLVACVHQSIATGSIAGYTLTSDAAELQDQDKLSQAEDAYGANHYSDAIRIGKDVIANSPDPDVQDEAKLLVILSTRSEYGYDAAMREVASLNASTALSDLIKGQQSSYNEGVAEQAKIIAENPGTEAARNAELEVCRFKDVNSTRQDAITAYEQLCAKYKGQLVARNATFALARIYSLSGDIEKAQQVLLQFAVNNSNNPQSERAINKLGEIVIHNKRYDDGVKYLRAFQQAHKDELNTSMGSAIARTLGLMLEFQGNHSDALSACAEAAKRAGNCMSAGEAVKLMKKIHMTLNQPSEALDRMSAILTGYPGTESAACAQYCIAEVHQAQGHMDLAEQAFEAVISGYPASGQVQNAGHALVTQYIAQATAFDAAGNPESAVPFWEKALKYPEVGTAYDVINALACDLLGLGKYSEIHTRVSIFLKNSAVGQSALRDNLSYLDAMAYYCEGDYGSALPKLRAIVSTTDQADQKEVLGKLIVEAESKTVQNHVGP